MPAPRLILIGVAAAAASAVLAYVLQVVLAPAGGGATAGTPKVTLVTAARDLPAGHRLTESDLEQVEMQSRPSGEALVMNRALAVGRTTSVSLSKGQAIRTGDLVGAGSGASIASQLSSGMRAITVSLRDTGPEVVLYPGALVDVLATLERPARTGEPRDTVTLTLLEGVRVLAVNDEAVGAKSPADAPTDRRMASRKLTVTLAVTPEQAAQVELASSRGTVGIALRPDGDRTSSAEPGASATARSILGLPDPVDAPAAPAAAADARSTRASSPPSQLPAPVTAPERAVWQVTVIRGDTKSTHEFPSAAPEQSPPVKP
jgi:pilus assembly protein CpaB